MPRTGRVSEAGDGPDDVVATPTSAGAEASGPVDGQARAEPSGDLARHEHYARHLRTTSAAMFQHTAMAPFLKGIDPQAYMLYHDRLLADCGDPVDPVERMIIEQLALAHFSLGLLFAKTSNGGKVEAVGIYAGATARLMGEFRRSALALQAYRHASQQLARDPAKDLVIPDGEIESSSDLPEKTRPEDEEGKRVEEADADDAIIPYREPADRGPGRPPAEGGPDQPRGARKAPRRRPGDPALGEGHRTANG